MFSVHSTHKVDDAESVPFSPELYSKFKYGAMAPARQFGEELFESFRTEFGTELLDQERVILLSSPFGHIPTASFYLTRSFERSANLFRAKHNKPALVFSKIHRNKTYSDDYGALSQEERLRLITKDTYHIDAELLKGKLVLLIDDIKITGSHELVMRRLIEERGIEGHFVFLYYGELVNPDIDPSFENFLNYYFVKNIDHVRQIMEASEFRFNTRVIKYILSRPMNEFETFVEQCTCEFIAEMVDYAIGNNYHLMPAYGENLTAALKRTKKLL